MKTGICSIYWILLKWNKRNVVVYQSIRSVKSLAVSTELQLQTQDLVNSAKHVTSGVFFIYILYYYYVNGQTQVEPESCVTHRVWNLIKNVSLCTSWCVQGKTDGKHYCCTP